MWGIFCVCLMQIAVLSGAALPTTQETSFFSIEESLGSDVITRLEDSLDDSSVPLLPSDVVKETLNGVRDLQQSTQEEAVDDTAQSIINDSKYQYWQITTTAAQEHNATLSRLFYDVTKLCGNQHTAAGTVKENVLAAVNRSRIAHDVREHQIQIVRSSTDTRRAAYNTITQQTNKITELLREEIRTERGERGKTHWEIFDDLLDVMESKLNRSVQTVLEIQKILGRKAHVDEVTASNLTHVLRCEECRENSRKLHNFTSKIDAINDRPARNCENKVKEHSRLFQNQKLRSAQLTGIMGRVSEWYVIAHTQDDDHTSQSDQTQNSLSHLEAMIEQQPSHSDISDINLTS